jgi:hypothetical protein
MKFSTTQTIAIVAFLAGQNYAAPAGGDDSYQSFYPSIPEKSFVHARPKTNAGTSDFSPANIENGYTTAQEEIGFANDAAQLNDVERQIEGNEQTSPFEDPRYGPGYANIQSNDGDYTPFADDAHAPAEEPTGGEEPIEDKIIGYVRGVPVYQSDLNRPLYEPSPEPYPGGASQFDAESEDELDDMAMGKTEMAGAIAGAAVGCVYSCARMGFHGVKGGWKHNGIKGAAQSGLECAFTGGILGAAEGAGYGARKAHKLKERIKNCSVFRG